MYKALISGGRFDPASKKVVPVEPALNFGDILYPYIKDHAIEWATGDSSFVILALLESEDFSKKDELKKSLKASKKRLEKSAKEETVEQKSKREAGAASETKSSKKAKAKTPNVGNRGAALILEKL